MKIVEKKIIMETLDTVFNYTEIKVMFFENHNLDHILWTNLNRCNSLR